MKLRFTWDFCNQKIHLQQLDPPASELSGSTSEFQKYRLLKIYEMLDRIVSLKYVTYCSVGK